MQHSNLMRGCHLGATLVCRADLQRRCDGAMNSEHARSRTLSRCGHDRYRAVLARVLRRPPAARAQLRLQLARDNAAPLAMVVPHLTFAVALLWNTSWKRRAFGMARQRAAPVPPSSYHHRQSERPRSHLLSLSKSHSSSTLQIFGSDTHRRSGCSRLRARFPIRIFLAHTQVF